MAFITIVYITYVLAYKIIYYNGCFSLTTLNNFVFFFTSLLEKTLSIHAFTSYHYYDALFTKLT